MCFFSIIFVVFLGGFIVLGIVFLERWFEWNYLGKKVDGFCLGEQFFLIVFYKNFWGGLIKEEIWDVLVLLYSDFVGFNLIEVNDVGRYDLLIYWMLLNQFY